MPPPHPPRAGSRARWRRVLDDERSLLRRLAEAVRLPQSSAACSCARYRGAITVEENDADAILSATEELVREVMQRNSLEPEQMVSCIFTCTNDLDAEFPAVAARRLGLSSVPLLCARARLTWPAHSRA